MEQVRLRQMIILVVLLTMIMQTLWIVMTMITHHLIGIIQTSDPHLKSIQCPHMGSIITRRMELFGKKRNRINVVENMMMIRVETTE